MHKSKGNAIWFEDAADKMGVDVMRWMYLRHTPANNLNFGYGPGDEVRRQFHIPIWNVYSFFVNYANIDGWQPVTVDGGYAEAAEFTELDRWIRSELHQTIAGRHHCAGDVASRDCRHRAGTVRGRALQLVRTPQPAPLLARRAGRAVTQRAGIEQHGSENSIVPDPV